MNPKVKVEISQNTEGYLYNTTFEKKTISLPIISFYTTTKQTPPNYH
jgi:hypothetical protein